MGRAALVKLGAKKLLRSAVFEAIRVVRTDNTPPGTPTQPTEKKKRARVAAETVTSVITRTRLGQITVDDGSGPSIDFDLLPSPEASAAFDLVEHRLDLEKLLASATPFVASTLHSIHFEDATM